MSTHLPPSVIGCPAFWSQSRTKHLEIDDRRDEIHYNGNHSWHRKRFSIAHEIGHLLFNTSCHVPHRVRTVEEKEADQFAAELLVPLAFLKADFAKGSVDVRSLAWRYIVSEEAMGWKIVDSKLL